MLAYKEGDRVQLLSRNAIDRTERFPKIAAAILALRPATLLDGEMVVFDKNGVSRFQLLQKGKGEAVFAVFDCLYESGKDLRRQPLSLRRAVLEKAIASNARLKSSRRLAPNGLKAYREAKRKGYEGLVAKDASSPYVEGRSSSWLKVKVHQEDEFVIVGYTAPSGARKSSAPFCWARMTPENSATWERLERDRPENARFTLREVQALREEGACDR